VLFAGGWILGDVLKAHARRYVQTFTIPSRSMEPTLLWGDYVMADNAVYRGRRPVRGDIVVYRYPEDERRTFVGRIIGAPGETIQVRGPDVVINGRALEEPYIKRSLGRVSEFCGYAYGCEPIEVSAGRYFLMGDHRDNSRDSRYFGFVRHEAIIGRVFTIYWSWDSERHWLRRGRVGKTI
jgi:signal peptidase I